MSQGKYPASSESPSLVARILRGFFLLLLPAGLWKRLTFWRVTASLYLYVWAFLALGAFSACLAAFLVYDHVTQPGAQGPKVAFTVPDGATGQAVGTLLQEAGFVEHEAFFRLALKLDRDPKPIRAGIYDLPRGFSAMQLLKRLQDKPTRSLLGDQFKLTVPEGLSLPQIAALFEDPEAFLKAAADPAFRTHLPFEAPNLEGFLMPDTYFFDAPPKPREAIERMLTHFRKNWERLQAEFPEASTRDPLEVVTLASMVEEEARVETERPLVAAVLNNRIAQEMPLQMDSTLQFALQKYGQRMLDEDKKADSPYNTYLYTGLPPGPISSPGLSSLRAAMRPADVDYLYFVSNADGETHTFSSTYADHQKAVARFRKEIAVQRAEQAQ